jgi:hypothetical protein
LLFYIENKFSQISPLEKGRIARNTQFLLTKRIKTQSQNATNRNFISHLHELLVFLQQQHGLMN